MAAQAVDRLKIMRDLAAPGLARGAAIAIGNFDGVHRGHQVVIGEAVRHARAAGCPAGVLTFEPHPRRYFQPDGPPFLLTRLRTKARVMAGLGVDVVYVPRFGPAIAGMAAAEFVGEILVRRLAVRHVVIGYDFVFGKGRTGTPELMRERLAAAGTGCTIMSPVTLAEAPPDSAPDTHVISSTAIRDCLKAGDPRGAAKLLGRPFEIEGHVRRGDQRGRTIGFPTANLWLGDYLRPALGVYAVRVGIGEGASALSGPTRWQDGVANLGLRPTFGGTEPRLEVHLFDFSEDLYGRRLRVELIEFLRPERKFDGLEALRAQIAQDAAAARRALAAPAGRARVAPVL